jgi:anti-anti-sigma factor
MNVEHEQGHALFHIPSIFNHTGTAEFSKAVREELSGGAKTVFADFADTELIDSAAIGTLVSVIKDFKASGAVLTLRNLNEDIRQLFTDTGFDKIFNIEYREGVRAAELDIFENAVDVRLYIEKETIADVCVFHLNGVMNNPQGTRYFKQEFLLTMARFKKILVDFKELTFFDSLSVSVVLNMNRILKETGGGMRICGSNEIVSDLFNALNIRRIIPFFQTQEEALNNWT